MPDEFLLKSTQIQKKSVGQNMNIWINTSPPPPISVLGTSLFRKDIIKQISNIDILYSRYSRKKQENKKISSQENFGFIPKTLSNQWFWIVFSWISRMQDAHFRILFYFVDQWRRHGVDWGGRVPPICHRGQFSNSSKSGEKGGGGYDSGIKSRNTGLGKFQNKRHSCSNIYINM